MLIQLDDEAIYLDMQESFITFEDIQFFDYLQTNHTHSEAPNSLKTNLNPSK